VACAVEVFTRAAESGNTEYVGLVAEVEGKIVGVLAYGQTPMTVGTYDLYWIASHPELRRRGIGAALVQAMEEDLHRHGARLVRIETSGTPIYDPTRAFYERFGYAETARLRDFYKPGDDLVIFTKHL
jgi:ribosomal protein S18 acetylase RimI-like enzyme